MSDDNIVMFPDSKIVRQETSVSFENMQKFILYHKMAENAGAEFWAHKDFAVSFKTMDEFESFCEMLTEIKYS
jgi:hypothetical protein